MKKQFHISTGSDEKIVIDLVEDESVNLSIENPPQRFPEEISSPALRITGLRWRDSKHFHLSWVDRTIDIGSHISIRYKESDDSATKYSLEQYVEPEIKCGFCFKPASEVEVIIERNTIAKICSSCVDICVDEIATYRTRKAQSDDA